MFKQALNTVRIATGDESIHSEVLSKLGALVEKISLNNTPATLSKPAYKIIAELTGNSDPYSKHKKESNRLALEMLPDMRSLVMNSADPMDAALHLAAAGNIIDAGIGHMFDIKKDIAEFIHRRFAISAIDDFKKELGAGKTLLYLGDNAGEIVFDTVLVDLIQQTGTKVIYSVKSSPIINDATMEDAEFSGMTDLTSVIETGSDDIGVDFRNVSKEFMNIFKTADLILGKGHGNFETCNERPENLYFLLKAKCEMVANELEVNLGDLVFKHYPPS